MLPLAPHRLSARGCKRLKRAEHAKVDMAAYYLAQRLSVNGIEGHLMVRVKKRAERFQRSGQAAFRFGPYVFPEPVRRLRIFWMLIRESVST